MVKICTTVVTLLFAINIIFFYPATYLKENRLDFKVLEERKLDSQIELYDLNTILLFDDNVWCLNVSKNCIMVFSKEGELKKTFCLPGVRDKGSSRMYIYHDQLCVRDKHNVLYQFVSVDEYRKIFLKDDNEVQAFDKSGNMTDRIKLDKEYDEALLLLKGQCYLDKRESDEITIYKESGKKQKEQIDYEKLTNMRGNKQDSSEGVIYRIGGINNKIIKEEDGKKTILKKSDMGELLFLSADMHLVMITLLIMVQSARYFLQHI